MSANAGPVVIWNGVDAKFLNSGSVQIPSLTAGMCTTDSTGLIGLATVSTPLNFSSNTLSCNMASGSTAGCISAANFSSFSDHSLSSITAATTTNTIDNVNWAQVWNWNSLTSETGMKMASAATGFTGTLGHFSLTGNNAANTGTVLKASVTGTSSPAVPLMVTNNGIGNSFLVNDDGTDTDATPFVVTKDGNVGIQTASPRGALDILTNGNSYIESGSGSVFLGDYSAVDSGVNLIINGGDPADGFHFTGGDTIFQNSNIISTNGDGLFQAGQVTIGRATHPGGIPLTVNRTDTDGNRVLETLRLSIEDSNSAASNGIGARINYSIETATSALFRDAAYIDAAWDDATDSSRDASLRFSTTGPNATSTAVPTERMRIDSSGRVGIGVTSPAVSLDINGVADTTGQVSLNLRSGNNPVATPLSNQVTLAYAGTNQYRHAIKSRHNGGSKSFNAIDFYLWDQGVDSANDVGTKQVLTLEGTGNVGIGTTSPNAALDINSSTSGLQLRVGNDSTTTTLNQLLLSYGGGIQYPHAIKTRHNSGAASGNNIDFYLWNFGVDSAGTVGTKRVMTLDGTGNVGIGTTTNPTSRLDVKGSTSDATDAAFTIYTAAGGSTFRVVNNGTAVVNNGRLRSTQTTPPTATVNANAGTGASCSLTTASDTKGSVSLTTTAVLSSAGVECDITFNVAYNAAPICVFSPTNNNAANNTVIQGVFFTKSTTKLSVNFATTDAVGRTYTWDYVCIE